MVRKNKRVDREREMGGESVVTGCKSPSLLQLNGAVYRRVGRKERGGVL